MPVSEVNTSDTRGGPEKGKEEEEEYYTANEVAEHNAPNDCWLSWLGHVYDLTDLAKKYEGNPQLTPILQNSGSDISHWFDQKTGDPKTHIDPVSNLRVPYTPMGRFVHIPPPTPRTDYNYLDGDGHEDDDGTQYLPWWKDKKKYRKGRLSQKTRRIRIVNCLTGDECILEVCSEESLQAIQKRYLQFNAHAKGYTWKRLGNILDMSQNLKLNGVEDESEVMERVGMDEEEWLPRVHLYFADDLTVG